MAAFISGCGETPYVIYENAGAAKADGAITRGWLPEWLPDGAYDIHEHHDLDTNVHAFSFKLTVPEKFQWPQGCVKVKDVKNPSISTKLFPKRLNHLSDVRHCGRLYVVLDPNGIVHGWN